MSWANAYVGLPFVDRGQERAGVSCSGLICLIYREQFGITVPNYAEECAGIEDHEGIAAVIEGRSSAYPWASIKVGCERPFDVALFQRGGVGSHVGIVVEPGLMVHAVSGRLSNIERYGTGSWRHRLAGFIRHHALIGREL